MKTFSYGDISQTHRVVKKGEDSYEHHIVVKYPSENVKNMRASWVKTIEQVDESLAQHKEVLEQQYETWCKNLELEIEAAQNDLAEQLSKTPEQIKEDLYSQFLTEVEKKQKELGEVDKMKETFRTRLEEESKKILAELKQRKKTARENLEVWNTPTHK